jgi:N-acetylmuramoyl-L-alanine amidase
MRITIDPGHGGPDAGACSGGTKEANINLAVSLKLAENLRRAGHEVLLTRQADVGLAPAGFTGEKRRNADLSARPAMARNFKSDLFVSVHSNSVSDPKAKGIEVFHYTHPALAASVLKYLLAFTDAVNRGVKVPPPTSDPDDDPAKLAHWPVLHDPGCPAVLVECGFMSNPGELAFLLQPAYQVRLACAIAAGVMAYQGEVTK